MTSLFSLVSAILARNYVSNPSNELNANGWTTVGAGANSNARSNVTPLQEWGLYYNRVITSTTIGEGCEYAEALTGPTTSGGYSVSFWIRLNSGSYTNGIRLKVLDGASSRYDAVIPLINTTPLRVTVPGITLTNGQTFHIQILTETAAVHTVFIDGLQVENNAFVTDYVDGDRDGCYWEGTPHASHSVRPASWRLGGRQLDFQDDLSADVTDWKGIGVPMYDIAYADRAQSQVRGYQGSRAKIRVIDLDLWINGSSLTDLHSKRKTLLGYLTPETPVTPKYLAPTVGSRDQQTILLRYTGGPEVVEIPVVYRSGLEYESAPGFLQRPTIRLEAPDPFWRRLYQSVAALDVRDNATVYYFMGRQSGLWGTLTQPASVAGSPSVEAIALGPDGCIYIGGGFTNWDGIAAADFVVKYDPVAGTYSALSNGFTGGNVYVLRFAADGTLYAGGTFTSATGIANTAGIAKWNGTTWSAVGTGVTAGTVDVRDIAIGADGTVYATGEFTTMGGVANTLKIAKWSGSAWSAMGTGISTGTKGYALAVGPDGTVYVGGVFSQLNAVACANIGKWTGTTFAPLGVGTNGDIYALVFDSNGNLYAGGSFTTAGGVTTNRIAMWNGSRWSGLSTGMTSGAVAALAVNPITGSDVYAGGSFTVAGGITISEGIARWNGATWTHLDMQLPGTPNIVGLMVTPRNDLYIGFDTTGTNGYAGNITITNPSATTQYPVLRFKATAAGHTLIAISNQTTGDELFFDYVIQNGEELVIDLRPGAKSITSSIRGKVQGATLPNSDLASFGLQPGANVITSLVGGANATSECSLVALWRPGYLSADEASA